MRPQIFGQSGGGAMCATLMAMPAAHGLFHRVWTMSGQQITATRPVTGNRNAGLLAQMTGSGPEAQRVADQMAEALLGFARTGNPDTKAIPHWPAFSLAGRPTMVFDTAARVVNGPRGDERRMFEKVPYVQPGT